MADAHKILQLALSRSVREKKLIPVTESTVEERGRDFEELRNELGSRAWVTDIGQRFHKHTTPNPLYFPKAFVLDFERLQSAFTRAVTDIVERWWRDEAAEFPRRMPLEKHEEDLLKWIAGPGASVTRDFRLWKGCWRPDFLIERSIDSTGEAIHGIRLCEINARFPFNAFFHSARTGKALAKLGITAAGLAPCTMQEKVFPAILGLYDHSKPLHILREHWSGADIHFVKNLFRDSTGQLVREVKPSQIRCFPDTESPTGWSLFCAIRDDREDGAELERIFQVSLELEQDEYRAFDHTTLCQIATCCVNDPRSIFLVHDKRMFAIILEELETLVARDTLTVEDAEVLRKGLASTMIPTSSAWSEHMQSCKSDNTVKDDFLLKPIRSGGAQGQIWGEDVSNEEWMRLLQNAREETSKLERDQVSYVLQRRVRQAEYVIIRRLVEEVEKLHLVGHSFAIHGQFLGIGGCRLANERHISVNDREKGVMLPAFTDS